MVLQRAPASAMVYGHAKLGSTVTTMFGGKNYTTTTDSIDVGDGQGLGTWRQALPPTPGGKTAYTLTFVSSAGDRATLTDVLFGEVYFCSGAFGYHGSSASAAHAYVMSLLSLICARACMQARATWRIRC